MASYVELIRRDVFRHKSYEASSWPSSVSERVQSLQNGLKIPNCNWLKSGSVQYTNESVIDLLEELRASDDAYNADLWDNTNKSIDKETEQRLHVVFNTALIDCARIRAVIKAENQTYTPFPKESFLVILVRNAILNVHARLSSLEDVPVVLPRHFSGEAIPILDYMTKNFYSPLIISICQEMPVEESGPDFGHQPSDEKDSSVESELFRHSPPTMSEFLDACERPKTPEKVESEQEEGFLSLRSEAYFLAYPPSATPPSICHIPVLCMTSEEQLPVLMSSLLYQRRVWHIDDPLIGLEFSKYDTTIRLVVGWLEENLPSDRVLPRVHLGEIGTPVKLDLSSPSVALVVSRLLCGLESHISGVRDSVRHSVGAVIRETQSHSSLSWRIDTDIRKEGSASILENDNTRDMIIQWIESQGYSVGEETMPARKQVDKISLPGSATSLPPPQQSTTTQSSYPPPASSATSKEEGSPISELREPDAYTDSISTFRSPLSCSAFAATTEKDDHRVFRWMFDRRVVPQSIPSDLEFREDYSAMTGFIWPEEWRARKDLPPVDAALEPCIGELLESVATLKTRPGAVKCVPAKEFPVDLRILEQSFSAIFQASRRSHEKRQLQENAYEAAWRHDHDRLLFDFFIRLVQPMERGAPYTLIDGHSIAYLEDPLSRPTLETTLRFPKSDILQSSDQEELQMSMVGLVDRRTTDLVSWLQSRDVSKGAYLKESQNAIYVSSQWSAWVEETNAETEASMIAKLGEIPSTGRCDALGRLVVELPNVSPKDVGHFPLVVRPTRKSDGGGAANEVEASASGSWARTFRSQGKASTKTPSSSLTVPNVSSGSQTRMNGTRYTIPSSSVSTSMQSLDKGRMGSVESMDVLASKAQRLGLGAGAACLELPILTAKYKKASEISIKGANQVRMYLTASVKFLQAVGITNVPVYGVQTDGPIVVLPAAVLRDDNFVYLFERLVERLDISTPLGAWHYATILCRLAQNHAKVLEKKFEEVRGNLVTSLKNGNQVEGWTIDYQVASLKAENKAKLPPQKTSRKQEPEAD